MNAHCLLVRTYTDSHFGNGLAWSNKLTIYIYSLVCARRHAQKCSWAVFVIVSNRKQPSWPSEVELNSHKRMKMNRISSQISWLNPTNMMLITETPLPLMQYDSIHVKLKIRKKKWWCVDSYLGVNLKKREGMVITIIIYTPTVIAWDTAFPFLLVSLHSWSQILGTMNGVMLVMSSPLVWLLQGRGRNHLSNNLLSCWRERTSCLHSLSDT